MRIQRRNVLGVVAALVAAGTLLVAPAPAATAAERDEALHHALEQLVAAGAPGAMALVRERGRTSMHAVGSARLRPRQALRPTDRFRVGSVTKTFVATVVLQLAGEGRLSLDDTLERWLPGAVPGGDAITLRQLLSHTSGVFNYTDDPAVFQPYLQGNLAFAYTPAQLIAIANAHPPTFAPGTGWSYSNTGYILLGLIVEAATGAPLEAELQRRVFAPLGLRRTSYDVARAMTGRYAHGYYRLENGMRVDVTALSLSWAGAAGAIVSTMQDVARFYRALLTGRLLRADLLAAMKIAPPGQPAGEGYGLGLWQTRSGGFPPPNRWTCRPFWGHNGGLAGYLTFAFSSENAQYQMVVAVTSDTLSERAQRRLRRVLDVAACG